LSLLNWPVNGFVFLAVTAVGSVALPPLVVVIGSQSFGTLGLKSAPNDDDNSLEKKLLAKRTV